MTNLTKETALLMMKSEDKAVRQFAIDNYPELGGKPLPKSWNHLPRIVGYFVLVNSEIAKADAYAVSVNRNVRATEEQAEASIAMTQLSQLMKAYNDGREPNWGDDKEIKYCIHYFEEDIRHCRSDVIRKFLAFKSDKLRYEFQKNFSDLIRKAKPLL